MAPAPVTTYVSIHPTTKVCRLSWNFLVKECIIKLIF